MFSSISSCYNVKGSSVNTIILNIERDYIKAFENVQYILRRLFLKLPFRSNISSLMPGYITVISSTSCKKETKNKYQALLDPGKYKITKKHIYFKLKPLYLLYY